MSYSIPPIGTVLPARENVDPTIPNPGPTTQADIFYEWLQAFLQDKAFQQTAQLKATYLNFSFPSWLNQTYRFQPDPDLAPPKPPAAFIVLVAPAENGGPDFQSLPSGTILTIPFTPLPDSLPENSTYGPDYSTGPYIAACEVPAYTKIAPPNNPADNKIAQPAVEKHGHHKK